MKQFFSRIFKDVGTLSLLLHLKKILKKTVYTAIIIFKKTSALMTVNRQFVVNIL